MVYLFTKKCATTCWFPDGISPWRVYPRTGGSGGYSPIHKNNECAKSSVKKKDTREKVRGGGAAGDGGHFSLVLFSLCGRGKRPAPSSTGRTYPKTEWKKM